MNCPNCAAPITGPICEYCGTMHVQSIDIVRVPMSLASLTEQKLMDIEDAIRCSRYGIMAINDIRKEFGLKEL